MPLSRSGTRRRLRPVPLVLLAAAALAAAAAHGSEPEPGSAPAAGAPIAAPPAGAAAAAPRAAAEPGTSAVAAEPGDGIPVLGWEAGAARVPSAESAWGGPRTGKEPTLSQRVADYDLRAVIDPEKHTIEGTEQLLWRNRSDRPVRTVYFHTYLNGFEGEGSTFMAEKRRYGSFRSGVELKQGEWGWIDVLSVTQGGRPAAFRYVQPDGGPVTDRTVLRVDLPEAVPPGGEARLELRFHDQLPRVSARTGWFGNFNLAGQWFPKIGVLELAGERGAAGPRWNVHEFHLHSEFYADWGSYRLEVVTPKGFTVGASGVRLGPPVETPEGLAHRFRQDDIHDVAFAAWDGFAPAITGSYDGPGSPHVEVEVLFPPEYADAGQVTLQATLDSLKYFSETLGPFPYPHVTAVIPPYNAGEAGGMEYETFFTSSGFTGRALPLVRYVTVHEFGHGYFMGLLASNEFEEPFLDEGLNEWWDSRMLQDEQITLGTGAVARLGISLPPFRIFDFQWLTGSGASGRALPDAIAGNSWQRMSAQTYNVIYPRTALVMHDLEARLGGDAVARGMKLYYQRWHHRHPSAADLRAALIDAAPASKQLIEGWFEEQLFGSAPVDDAVDQVEAEEVLPRAGTLLREGKHVEVTPAEVEKQIAEARKAYRQAHPAGDEKGGGPFPYRSVVRARRNGAQVQQTLQVDFADGSKETLVWPPGERWHRWVFERPAKVTQARLDPQAEVLLDVNKLDDGRTREAHKLPAVRWSLEAATWFELLLSLTGGL